MRASQFAQKIKNYLSYVVQQNGSDLHLAVGQLPIIRIDGKLIRLDQEEAITDEDMQVFAQAMLNDDRKKRLEDDKHLDFSMEIESGDRFRANLFYQKGHLSLALRLIPCKIKGLSELSMPENIYDFMNRSQGLFLITGPTGHGKSTTLASLIDYVNHRKQKHIITIEDPIEYIHNSDKCLIEQREVTVDAKDFSSALKACFREDVDIILVGEMRDLETISIAITAAETGHLVLGTLHTNDSTQTIDRIIDVFPAYQQNQVRFQLANVLSGVISQRLLKQVGGGRVPAVEILIKNRAVENLIRQNQTHQIGVVIETSLEQGMISINRSLANLVREGKVAVEDAEPYVTDLSSFKMMLADY